MRDFQAFRRTAIKYWERRRIIYNLALVLPGLVGYAVTDALNWAGDAHPIHYLYIVSLFVLSAIGANVCYSFAYALEFLFGSDDPASSWLRSGRTSAFVGGVLFAMLLALIGGGNIAQMEWNYGIRNAQRLQTP